MKMMRKRIIKEKRDRTVRGKNRYLYLFCLLAALPALLLCSKSSPLYPFNDWPDVNIFFTLGKGMMHGLVPYVNLMDQKGPYIYGLSAIAYLLSHKSFLGYFLFEVLSMSVFLYYGGKIIGLYTKGFSLWVLPLLAVGVTVSESFVHGGSLEELTLGIFAYGLYSLLSFLKSEEKENMSYGVIAVNGILAGVLLWSKFTLLGFYIAWVLIAAAVYAFRKRWKELWKAAGIFAAAVLAATLPWVIYFGMHNAVGEWLEVYLRNNIFSYSSGKGIPFWQRLQTAVLNTLQSLKNKENLSYSLFVILGCAGYVCFSRKRISIGEKAAVVFLGLGMALGIFIGGTKHDYYGLPLAVFSVFGGLLLAVLSDNLMNRLLRQEKALTIVKAAACGAAFLAAIAGSLAFSPNTYLLKVKKEEMPQYRFAQIIEQSEDKSLLNYGFLDGGFYTVLGECPTVKYYFVMNMNPDVILAQQNQYVQEGITNFVVTWKAYEASEEELKALPVLSEYYELADYQYFYFEGDNRTYALYRKRG